MKKQVIILGVILAILLFLFLILKPLFTGYSVSHSENQNEKIKIGYCPTMQEEAKEIADKNNYELVELNSALEVLQALNKNQIDKALIGRKVYSYEKSENMIERVLDSGYTLVSNQKRFIDVSVLKNSEIHTYLKKEIVEDLFLDSSKIIYYDSKNDAIKKIYEGKLVLIFWEDWEDEFELIVVMNGVQKVREFRGVFLYENEIL